MKVDILVAEIGSTTTIVNAFNIHTNTPAFLGRGVYQTTVDTDVNTGLNKAIADLASNLDVEKVSYTKMYATSSAAGGLIVTVHGLVYEMTVRASKEAALNAGANIHLVTAGRLRDSDLEKIKELKPNIIIIAGGTDYGERRTSIYNMEEVLKLKLNIPLIYAGNIENREEIISFTKQYKQYHLLKIVPNVYPRVDQLEILPLRKVIYETFEENIIYAKGMANVKKMVNRHIMPTPGSVMESTLKLKEELGNIMTIDVGGATTDIHSVSLPSEDFLEYLEGEPLSKRTVEGDLGVFINHENVLKNFNQADLLKELTIDKTTFSALINNYSYIPKTPMQRKLVFALTKKCVNLALDRHVGDLRRVFTTSGQKIIPEGKDLSQVETIVLTGGALINLKDTESIIRDYIKKNKTKMMPSNNVKIVKDHNYIMASMGVLSLVYPKEAMDLLKQSLRM